jgi:hypothetical protein
MNPPNDHRRRDYGEREAKGSKSTQRMQKHRSALPGRETTSEPQCLPAWLELKRHVEHGISESSENSSRGGSPATPRMNLFASAPAMSREQNLIWPAYGAPKLP